MVEKKFSEYDRKKELIRKMGMSFRKGHPSSAYAEMRYEQRKMESIDSYFHQLRKIVEPSKYLKHVDHYIKMNKGALQLIKKNDGDWSLIPLGVQDSDVFVYGAAKGMPNLGMLLQKKGRPKGVTIDDVITDILVANLKMTTATICKKIDEKKVPMPSTDNWRGISFWRDAYKDAHLRQLIQTRVSKLRKKLKLEEPEH